MTYDSLPPTAVVMSDSEFVARGSANFVTSVKGRAAYALVKMDNKKARAAIEEARATPLHPYVTRKIQAALAAEDQ